MWPYLKERDKIPSPSGRQESAFSGRQLGLVQKVDSCSFLHSHASGTERRQRKERRTQEYLASNQPLITSEGEKVKSKHPLLYRGEEDRLTTNARKVQRPDLRLELKFPCPWGARCRKSSCDYRHPPVCRNHKSGNRCIHGNNCMYRHADGEEKPSKRSKSESTQGAVAILTEKKVQGCVSQNSDPKKSILRKPGQTRLNASAGHALKFSGRTWYEVQNRERKGPSRGVIQKGEPHERNLCAPKFEERTPEETSRQEEYARKAAWNLARKYIKLKAEDKATFYSPVEIKAPVPVSKNTEERMFVVDSGASMHMLSKKDLSSDEMDTLRRSRNTTTVVTANGGSANKRGGTSVCSRSRSVRHSAITRRNASSSIAS